MRISHGSIVKRLTHRRLLRALTTGAAATVLAVGASAGTANAATWTSNTRVWVSADDPGGLGASSVLLRDAKTYYTVLFEPHGEELLMEDLLADGHAARAEVIVVNASGRFVESDTFYSSTADGARWINLGTPDGSGNIPEDYEVRIRVCINETSTCSWWESGIA